MREAAARRRIEGFRRRHGDPHLYLACHAAVPLALSPDLAYRLWANFQRDASGALLGIPWVAVADLLLSPLCDEVGDELYEMDEVVRSVLLEHLATDARFGANRLRRVATFLDVYVEQQLHSDDIDVRDFAQAQHWAALAYTAPSAAASELARAFASVPLADKPEVVRIASVVEALAAPLRSFTTLLTYAQAAQNLARGRDHPAVQELRSLAGPNNRVEVAGASIPVPSQQRQWDAALQRGAEWGLAGQVLVREADPRLLGVHAAISLPGVADESLPEYVPRDVDADIRALVTSAARRGGFVLLVGGSSVGKTRCAVEAVKALLPDWWLVHPGGASEVATLASAPSLRTVVWLDDLERYLDGEHGLTAAVMRALLNAPHPVVIIATLWPDRYTAYVTVPAPGGADPWAREREVLDLANVIRIEPTFSLAERERARAAAERDPRLRLALGTAGYGLTQTLAAMPLLVARWQDAKNVDPYAWAVLTAALDVARLGARAPIHADLLRAAAPGYCTSRQQAEAPQNWFEQALAYATRRLTGAVAPLSPAGFDQRQHTEYTVADYLIEHASLERRDERVPASTWDAVVSHIRDPADAARLADSAKTRMLYDYAIPLYRYAADAGDEAAARQLADLEDRAVAVQPAQEDSGSASDTLIARVALIRYIGPDGSRYVGSGLLIDERRVLTADHVARGSGHTVERAGRTHHVAAVLGSGTPEVDLAVLSLSEPVVGLQHLSCARINRSRVDRVTGCTAVGFPRWNEGDRRQSAQVTGWIPTAEGLTATTDSGLRAGWLTLVSDRISGAPAIPVGTSNEMSLSPWAGMSGAVVLADNLVIGVVRSQNIATGGNSFTVTPVTAIDQLPDKIQQQFWETLGVADSMQLPVLPSTPEPQPITRRPYFYLSYARTSRSNPAEKEDPDFWVHKLYDDLRAEILQISASSPEEAGFMDRENLKGTEWSSEVTAALAGCRVFVPLYSARYFASDWCGREWTAFARRLEEQATQGHSEYSGCIVPVLWTGLDPDNIPAVARDIQYTHHNLGERYQNDGIYGLIKLRRYREDYIRAVHRLAKRIVDVAEMVNLPPSSLSTVIPLSGFGSLASAFPTSSVGRKERAAALTMPDPATSSAVLVGTSSYHDSRLDPLPAVANNVEDLAAALADPALWGLPTDRSSVLLDQADTAQLARSLTERASRAQDTFLIYFAGHGLITPEGDLVLATSATNLDMTKYTGMPYAWIREIVGQCSASRRIVILDCCFSGRALNTMSDPATAVIGQLDVEGTYVMTSAPATSVSVAPPESRHTAFTGNLLAIMREGIPGAGELLTLDDLYEHTLRAMMLQGWPTPQKLGKNTIGRLGFLRNRAWSGAAAPDRLRSPGQPG